MTQPLNARTTPAPHLESAPADVLAAVRCLVTDVDGTMTRSGRLPPDVLALLPRLRAAGIEVLPATGRPAGEALGLARYLPGVCRAIAENGGVLVVPDAPLELLRPAVDRGAALAAAARLAGANPWRLAPCSFARVTDLAWLREDRHTEAALLALVPAAKSLGWSLTWSSVHLHLSHTPADKGSAVQALLQQTLLPRQIATIGDAANDAGLWTAGRFGLTVGTAEVRDCWNSLPAHPAYVVASGADGWCELAEALLRAH